MESKTSEEIIRRRYEGYNEYLKSSNKNVFYSYQRIDLVIVAFSTGALATIISSFKIIREIQSDCLKCIIVLTAFSYAFTIIMNIISQVYSAKHNAEQCGYAMRKLQIMNGIETEEYKNEDRFLSTTTTCNSISVVIFSIGILLSVLIMSILIYN
jgi:hypothetical protein